MKTLWSPVTQAVRQLGPVIRIFITACPEIIFSASPFPGILIHDHSTRDAIIVDNRAIDYISVIDRGEWRREKQWVLPPSGAY